MRFFKVLNRNLPYKIPEILFFPSYLHLFFTEGEIYYRKQ